MKAGGNYIRSTVLLSVVTLVLMGADGCTSMKYTATVDSSLKQERITSATIAVFPVDDMRYSPPSSCMGPTSSPDQKGEYEDMWNQKMRSGLQAKFADQNWVFLDLDSGLIASGEIDFGAVKELSTNAIRSTKINAMKADQIDYEPMSNSPRMQEYLSKLKNETNAEYAIVFVTPSLSGEQVTTYSYSQYGSSSSTQTYYTADVQILVWECATGKLLLSSGGWNKSSSSCFFVPPQPVALDGVNRSFEKKLELIIASLLRLDARKYVAQNGE